MSFIWKLNIQAKYHPNTKPHIIAMSWRPTDWEIPDPSTHKIASRKNTLTVGSVGSRSARKLTKILGAKWINFTHFARFSRLALSFIPCFPREISMCFQTAKRYPRGERLPNVSVKTTRVTEKTNANFMHKDKSLQITIHLNWMDNLMIPNKFNVQFQKSEIHPS